MAVFRLGGGAASYDANEAIVNFWNPASELAVRVRDLEIASQQSLVGSTLWVARTTTTGTAGSTITPGVGNHLGRRAAPASACVMYLGNFTVSPTEQTPALFRAVFQGATNGGMVGWWFSEPIVVPAGTGLAVLSTVAAAGLLCTVEWEE